MSIVLGKDSFLKNGAFLCRSNAFSVIYSITMKKGYNSGAL